MKIINGILVMLMVSLTFIACDEEESTNNNDLKSEDAVKAFETSFQPNAGGLLTNVQDAVSKTLKFTGSNNFNCSEIYTDNYGTEYEGIWIDSKYTSDYTASFDCNDKDIPNSASVNVNTDYLYNSEKINASSKGSFKGDIEGIHTDIENVIINGTYTQEGFSNFSYLGERTYDNKTEITLTDLKMDKGNYIWGVRPRIQSGSGVITYTFIGPNGYNYNFAGSIKFLSSRAGEITINGNTYSFGY